MQIINPDDDTFWNLIFVGNKTILSDSNNNIFDLTSRWSVRRVPEIDSLRDFVTSYFRGEDGAGGDGDRFLSIWDKIQNNDYTWLDLFFKQNNTLYFVADKSLNLFVPLSLTAGLSYYIVRT